MNKIDEIVQIMNSGIYNTSTLQVVVPLITQLCLERCPERANELQGWFISEAALSRQHPGLDERYKICSDAIANSRHIEQQATMKK